MTGVNNIAFCGQNYGVNNAVSQVANAGYTTPNFKASYDVYEVRQQKKKSSFLGALVTILGASALVIGGMGLAHKYDAVSKIKNDKIRKFVSKGNPAAERCYEWCSWTKAQGEKGINTVRGWFKKP